MGEQQAFYSTRAMRRELLEEWLMFQKCCYEMSIALSSVAKQVPLASDKSWWCRYCPWSAPSKWFSKVNHLWCFLGWTAGLFWWNYTGCRWQDTHAFCSISLTPSRVDSWMTGKEVSGEYACCTFVKMAQLQFLPANPHTESNPYCNAMWCMVSPAPAARSTSERPNRDWRRDWRNTGMPARGG